MTFGYHKPQCSQGGNALSVIMEIKNMVYPKAVRFLAERLQIEMLSEDA
ncbi:CHC2 zinc finger domain-containing protein [Pedobacter aquatilis]